MLKKIRRQATKDYLIHPLLSGPSFLHTVAANVVANMIRNVWSHSVIMCGHFPEGVETFEKRSIEGETQGRVVRPADAGLGQHLRLARPCTS